MIDLIGLALMLPFAMSSAYLGVLTALALTARQGHILPAPSDLRRFTVIIPAHNEERVLPALLASLDATDYPRDHTDVCVIADNCEDATATIARAGGATVFERFDQAQRAKGYAIAWLMEQSSFLSADAVVLIDADCIVSRNLFTALNDALRRGGDAFQVYYDIRDADATASLQLRQLALALVHLLRPTAKMRIGASAGLKGTGMCFTRELIARLGWDAHGLAEDVEQHLRLIEAGTVVRFVPEARVSGHMGRSLAGSSQQHQRWEAGRLHAARAYVPRLLKRGIRERNIAMLDAAAEQMTPPLSVIAAGALAGLGVATVLDLAATRIVAIASLVCIAAYVAGGIVMLRPRPVPLIRALAVAPFYIAWKLVSFARATTVGRTSAWVRTTRDETT